MKMNSANNKSSSEFMAAIEAAAKINAILIAKGKLKLPAAANRPKIVGTTKASGDLFTAEVEINDAPISARNMLTRGHTQDEVNKFSGAAVSTRGRYMSFEDRAKNNMGERPLYLHVQASNREAVDLAVQRIREIIQQHVKIVPSTGTKVATTTSTNTVVTISPPPLMSINTSMVHAGLQFVQDKVFIGLEHIPESFGVRDKILGPGGSYLQHVRSETGATITLRGKGSGLIEPISGREAFEPLHVHIIHSKLEGLQAARELVLNLIQTVQQEYNQWQQQQTLAAAFAVQTQTVPVSLQASTALGLGTVTTSIPNMLTHVTVPVTTLSTSMPNLTQSVIGQLTCPQITFSEGSNLMAHTYAVSAIDTHPSSTTATILSTQPSVVSPNSFALTQPLVTSTVHLSGVAQQLVQQQQQTSLPQMVTSHPSIIHHPATAQMTQATLQDHQQQTLLLMPQLQVNNLAAVQTAHHHHQQQQQQQHQQQQAAIILATSQSSNTLQQQNAMFSQAQPATQILLSQAPQAALVVPNQQQTALIQQSQQRSTTEYMASQIHQTNQLINAANATCYATTVDQSVRASLAAAANQQTFTYLPKESFMHQTSNANLLSQTQQNIMSQSVLTSPQHLPAGYQYQLSGHQSIGNSLNFSTVYPAYRQNDQPHKRHFSEEPSRKDEENRIMLGYQQQQQQKSMHLVGMSQASAMVTNDYLNKQGGLQSTSTSSGLVMPPPPPPPPLSSGTLQKERDKQLMPPPSLPPPSLQSCATGNKAPSRGESDRKRLKGALGSVAMYGNSDEEDDDNNTCNMSRLRQVHRVVKTKNYLSSGGNKLQGYATSGLSHQHVFSSASAKSGQAVYGSSHLSRQSTPFWMAPN